jgi:putative sterol carrier protein
LVLSWALSRTTTGAVAAVIVSESGTPNQRSRVMRSENMTTLMETLQDMMSRFNPAKAKGVNAVVQLNATGEDGGQYYMTIADSKATLSVGAAPTPTVTINVAAQDWIDIMGGTLDPTRAFMAGKLRITGDLGLMMRFQSMFS